MILARERAEQGVAAADAEGADLATRLAAALAEGEAVAERLAQQSSRAAAAEETATMLADEQEALSAELVRALLRQEELEREAAGLREAQDETVEADLADFKKALKDYDYVSGEKYSEWREGDKVAAYGLGALVLGGAAAVATSKGGFKAIGLAIVAGIAAVGAVFRRFFSRNKA